MDSLIEHQHQCELARSMLLQIADLDVNSKLVAMASLTPCSYPWLAEIWLKLHSTRPHATNEMVTAMAFEMARSNDQRFMMAWIEWRACAEAELTSDQATESSPCAASARGTAGTVALGRRIARGADVGR